MPTSANIAQDYLPMSPEVFREHIPYMAIRQLATLEKQLEELQEKLLAQREKLEKIANSGEIHERIPAQCSLSGVNTSIQHIDALLREYYETLI